MVRKSLLATLVALSCNPVLAIELGNLSLQSKLNEPLRAVLDIDAGSTSNLEDIRFNLANREAYRRFQLARPGYLREVLFKLSATANGSHELQISSSDRVVEPILNLLIHVDEMQGDFYRQYTLLVDPPGSRTETVQAPSTNRAVPAAPVVEPVATDRVVDGPQTILVQNRSISIIAQDSSLHDKYSVYQIMRAFYLVNPGAFINGNINKLMSGTRLTVPEEQLVAEVPRQTAINFVSARSRDLPAAAAPAPQVAAAKSPPASIVDTENKPPVPIMQRPRLIAADAVSGAAELPEQPLDAADDDTTASSDKQEALLIELIARVKQLETDFPLLQLASSVDLDTLKRSIAQSLAQPESSAEQSPAQVASAEANSEQSRDPFIAGPQLDAAMTSVSDSSEAAVTASVEPIPTAQIVTYPQPQQATSKHWWVEALLLISILLFALREWTWRKRWQTLVTAAPLAKSKPRTGEQNPEQMGTVELKQIERKQRDDASTQPAASTKSKPRHSLSSPESAKLEIEVLLAYQQFEEAEQLLETAQRKFGDSGWIQLKRLEILASTKQCEAFLKLFNQQRDALKAESPIAWNRIVKMRDALCAEFNISALG